MHSEMKTGAEIEASCLFGVIEVPGALCGFGIRRNPLGYNV